MAKNSLLASDLRNGGPQSTAECIDNTLRVLRQFIGLDVAFIAEFGDTHRIIQHVDEGLPDPLLELGQAIPMDVGYCLDVVEGRLPGLIADTRDFPLAVAKPETASFPIGCHLSVPIPLRNGDVYGTLCCIGTKPLPALGERDLEVMRAVAALVGSHLDTILEDRQRKIAMRTSIEAVISSGLPDIVYQPVIDIHTGRMVGAEALARFPSEPIRTPDLWFADATEVGLYEELTRAAIGKALECFGPAFEAGIALGLNISPSLAAQVDLEGMLTEYPTDRIFLEITEHDAVDDYDILSQTLTPLREKGVRIAIDDMGSGYANILHVLKVKPDAVKLDVSLIKDIDSDPAKQAWLAGVMEFARRSTCRVLAEGIETEAELLTLRELGVHYGQGFLLGKPMGIDLLVETARRLTPMEPLAVAV
jgi:EAL domain-containing protein (putative c-di-GMP-specific phosphodiesterase class I)